MRPDVEEGTRPNNSVEEGHALVKRGQRADAEEVYDDDGDHLDSHVADDRGGMNLEEEAARRVRAIEIEDNPDYEGEAAPSPIQQEVSRDLIVPCTKRRGRDTQIRETDDEERDVGEDWGNEE